MRIDKFLKLSRIVKRRTVAAEMADIGAVRLNGRTVKPSAEVKSGDAMEVAFPRRVLSVEILSADERAIKRGEAAFRITGERRVEETESPW